MENETFTSDLKKNFSSLISEVEKKYNVTVQFASIYGKRWAYLFGKVPSRNVEFDSKCIKLNKRLGIIIYGHSALEDLQKKRIEELFKKKLTEI